MLRMEAEEEGGRRPAGALPRSTRRTFLADAARAAAGLAALGALGAPAHAAPRFPGAEQFDAEVPAAWFELALDLVGTTPGYSPPVASRAFAYAGVTLYEAVLPGMEGHRSLLGGMPDAGRNAAYDWAAVANASLASIVRSLFATAPVARLAAVDALEARLADRAGGPPGVIARSARRGREIAAAVFERSKSDGGHEGYLRNFPPYQPPVGPGLWVPTSPGFQAALQPNWGANRCLAIAGGADHPAGDHPPFSEEPTSAFFGEAHECYRAVNELDAEREAIARFWSDDPGQTPTPPGHTIAITTQVLRERSVSLARAAEAYARVGMAVCDAFIACWYQKYTYNLLRPVTYINRLIDPDWLPLLVTPPFPEYPSGHSVQSGAGFQVLTDLFGDGYAFVDRTHERLGLDPRSFASFLAAADEAAISRLYGGIHYRAAIENGLLQGRQIGRAVSALPLREG
jgi:hypothetical protein